MSLIFYVFLLFIGYGIWGIVLHGMFMPRLDVGSGTLIFKFLLFGDAWFVDGKEEGDKWREEINT